MALTLAIANQKGGVGKTTIATQIAFDLALRRGKKVLYIDMDAQGNGTTVLKKGADIEGSEAHDLFDTSLDIVEPQPSNYPGIDIIPTKSNSVISYSLEGLSDECIRDPRMQLDKIRDRYDIIVIDCPPNLGIKLKASLTMADAVLCPIRLCGFSVEGLDGLLSTIDEIQQVDNPNLILAGVLINAFDNSVTQKAVLEHIQQTLQGIVMENVVRNRTPLDTANTYGIPVWEVPSAYRAVEELTQTFDEVYKKAGIGVAKVKQNKKKVAKK